MIPEVRERLDSGQARLGFVLLKLQELELHFQIIVFADAAGIVADFADLNGLRETLQIEFGEFQRGLREFRVDEEVGHRKRELALVIENKRGGDRCLVLGSLVTGLALLAALDQVTESNIAFRVVLQITRSGYARIYVGVLFGWRTESGKYSQSANNTGLGRKLAVISWSLLCSMAVRAASKVVVVLERQLNGLVHGDPDRTFQDQAGLLGSGRRRRGGGCGRRGRRRGILPERRARYPRAGQRDAASHNAFHRVAEMTIVIKPHNYTSKDSSGFGKTSLLLANQT